MAFLHGPDWGTAVQNLAAKATLPLAGAAMKASGAGMPVMPEDAAPPSIYELTIDSAKFTPADTHDGALLREALQAVGNDSKANAAIRRLNDPDSPDALLTRGLVALATPMSNRKDEAIALMRRAIAKGQPQAKLFLGVYLIGPAIVRKDPEEGVGYLERAR